MRILIKIATIISIIIATIKIGLMGSLTPQTTAIILVGAILILAGGKRLLKIVAGFLALFLFLKIHAGNDPTVTSELFQSIMALAIVLFGLYIIFRGFFRSFSR